MPVQEASDSDSKPKVLAVDDREANLIALEAIFQGLDCDFVPVTSGPEALELIQKGISSIALILLDAHMPIMDGFETAERIQKIPGAQKIPVIFLTAIDNNRSHIEKAYAAGAVDFIFKPINSDILLRKVSVFLELYSSRIQMAKAEKATYEARLKLVTNSVPALIAYVDTDLRYQFANAQFERWFGKSQKQIIGASLGHLVGPGPQERLKAYFAEALSGQNVSFTTLLPPKDGEVREIQVNIQPDFDSRKKVIGLVIHGSDISEAKRLENQMLELIGKFQSLFESIPQIVFITNPNGQVSQYNTKWYEYTGLPAGEISGESWNQVIHPEDAQLVFQSWDEVRQSGLIWTCEYRLRHFSGEYRWHLGRSVPIRSKESEIIRWIGTVTDIEDQKRAYEEQKEAQERIVESERLLDKVFNESPIYKAVVMGPDLIFNRANRRFFELMGPRDLIGQPARVALPELETQGFLNVLSDVYKTQKAHFFNDVPVAIHHPNGQIKSTYLDLYYQPLIDPDGSTFGVLIQGTDVTEKVVAQQKLKRNNDRSEFLSKASSVLNSSLDVDNILRQLADITVPGLADWCSIQIRQNNGMMKQVAVSHKDPEKVKWAFDLQKKYPARSDTNTGATQVARSGKPELVNGITHEMLKAAAQDAEHEKLLLSVGFHSFMCVPIRTRDHIIGTLSLISTDESHKNYTEEDLVLAQEIGIRAGVAVDNARLYLESQKINRIKDEFLATLSHELRTPLNVIQGHAEILKSDFEELSLDELKVSIDAIYRNALTQTALVGDLLDVSSIITGKISYNPQKISPEETFESIYSSLKPTATAKGVHLHCHVEGAPKIVSADPTRLHQILWNLASNALKFTDAGGHVTLTLKTSGQHWMVEVQDTGLGIDPAFLPYIFDRFTQEDSSRTRRFGGLGLGLSIVKYLAELHGGQVEAFSEGKDKGSLFRVTLPLFESSALGANKKTAVVAPSSKSHSSLDSSDPLHNIKILLVEDSEDNRVLIQMILSRLGAIVTSAASANQARDTLSSFSPDVIVSDIGMAEENGLEFIRTLRTSSDPKIKNIPAIALTAYARSEDKDEAIKAGFQSHVTKPINETTLAMEIRRMVDEGSLH